MRVPRPRSLAGQLFAAQVVLVTLAVGACAVYAYLTHRSRAEDAARSQVTATAMAIAHAPSVREAIGSPDPSAMLQPYAERVRKDSGATFITVMDPNGRRWTHPEPDRIGSTFVGHIGPARQGRTFTETYTGTLGPSVRVVAPIRSGEPGNRVIGLVSVGIGVENISAELRGALPPLLGVAGGALALGGLGTWLLSLRLRRDTHGMNAGELRRLHDYHQATLHAVREGLVLLDSEGRVALLNDGAGELLGLTPDQALGRHLRDLGLPPGLTAALASESPRVDELHLTADRVLTVNSSPVDGGRRRGTVITLRDHTELQALTGELDSVRGLTDALRAQSHEAANRLHTVVSLIELGRVREAVEFATTELELAQTLTDKLMAAVSEPVLAALLLGKAAQANERGAELVLSPDSRVDDGSLPPELPARDLVTVLGNLIDNALEALGTHPGAGGPTTGQRPEVRVSLLVRPLEDPATPASPTTTALPSSPGNGAPDPTPDPGDLPGQPTADGVAPTSARASAQRSAPSSDGASDGAPATGPNGAGKPQVTRDDGAEATRGPGEGPGPYSPGSEEGHGQAASGTPATPPGEAPVVTVPEGVERHGAGSPGWGRELWIEVADNGPGLPEDAGTRLFAPGWTTKAADGEEGGRGLGLALVGQAVRRNGGTVECGDCPEGGAWFTVRLPLGHARPPEDGGRQGGPREAATTVAVANTLPGGAGERP
ncbi:ATP-binding protein [Streptomyces sp. NPDC005438]|uniref:sensor histidine kinase n=1 Tax=Streptomyces sp. NPDC005438 TaxID=3156880 RepID=UPI0033B3695C